jgi:hypothetical protein
MGAFSILIQALKGFMELFKVTIEKEGDYHVKRVLYTL